MTKEIEAGIDINDPDKDLALNDVDKSATKAEAAVTMAMYGASYTDIAKTLHYSSAYRARMAVERALASAANSPEDREKMRVLIDKRLNRLLAAHMPKALDPNDAQQLAHSARALAIIDRQAKLHGVDAPTQVQFSPNDEYIAEFVESLRPMASRDNAAIEADILDADVIEGELS
jgi:hypothetical protein